VLRIYARLEARQADLRRQILVADGEEREPLVRLWQQIHSGEPVPIGPIE
jgi:hypothetical protein